MLQEWNIPQKVSAGVTDNANNTVDAIGLFWLGIEQFSCFAHTITLQMQEDC